MVLLTTAGAAGILVGGAQAVHAATVTAQAGDTVSGLASKYHSSINAIETANHINATTHLIFAGQKYNIPTGDDAQAATTSTQAATQQASQAQATASHAQAQQAASTQTTQTSTTSNTVATPAVSNAAAGGSTYAQFIAAGGTPALWNTIVMPESGGNANAVSPNGYHGLGQTKESWGYGSVAQQTKGLINYAVSRYGSVNGAVAFRASNNWW